MQQSFVARVLNLVVVSKKMVLTAGKELGCVEAECCMVERDHHLQKYNRISKVINIICCP